MIDSKTGIAHSLLAAQLGYLTPPPPESSRLILLVMLLLLLLYSNSATRTVEYSAEFLTPLP
ncbi:MAG: hypothetical protein ABS69_21200 [Nitrosomonadales bacterium SCN 54-20]|nr:MAG: hypothetical protein ABS69_21200 [Nitrosomonadales bacterium SCN 54-20]